MGSKIISVEEKGTGTEEDVVLWSSLFLFCDSDTGVSKENLQFLSPVFSVV